MSTTDILVIMLGGIGAVAMSLAGLWARAVHDKLSSIDDKLGNISHFEGKVETTLDDYERRLTRLEENHGRAQ